MKAIPIHEAKANLSKYIQQAKAGQPVYIGSFGKPEVMLTVISSQKKPPLFGALKGKIPPVSDAEWAESDKAVAELFEESLSKDDL